MQTQNIKCLLVLFTAILTVGVPLAQDAHFQTSEMQGFGTGEPLAGAATMTRTEDEVWARVATSGLSKKTAYSVWFIVFNQPDNCTGPCDLVDDGAAGIASFNVAGFVTGTDGTANFTTHVLAGDLPDGLAGFGRIDPSNGLDSEIHIVLRRHQGINVGSVAGQISTTEGPLGTNQQVAIFPAVP